jgi:orotate phosphoribosyltransferase
MILTINTERNKRMKTTTTESGIRFVNCALRIGAIELTPEGRKLKSGRISPYFFNAGKFHQGRAMFELATAYAAAIAEICKKGVVFKSQNFVIFGPAYKGIPLATVTSVVLWTNYGINISWSFNRKETKDHGEDGEIVGHPIAGMPIIAVDDVMTSGKTAEDVVKIIRQNRGFLAEYVISFDRQEIGIGEDGLSAIEEFQRKSMVSVTAASNLDDLIYVLKGRSDSKSQETLPLILDYREQYGILR